LPLCRRTGSGERSVAQLFDVYDVERTIAKRESGSMTWSRRLPKPIHLSDGRAIVTLAQARDVMLTLSHETQTNPYWREAAELLIKAAYRGRQDPIHDAGAQLSRALRADGLI
jgi:hypothetical protein